MVLFYLSGESEHNLHGFVSFGLLVFRPEVLPVHRADGEVQDRGEGGQAGHGVESAVVEEGAGINGSRGHDGHQLGQGQRLEMEL